MDNLWLGLMLKPQTIKRTNHAVKSARQKMGKKRKISQRNF